MTCRQDRLRDDIQNELRQTKAELSERIANRQDDDSDEEDEEKEPIHNSKNLHILPVRINEIVAQLNKAADEFAQKKQLSADSAHAHILQMIVLLKSP